MDCDRVQQLLTPYIDRELSDDPQHRVEKHLKQCSDCRQKMEDISGVKNLLDNTSSISPSVGFTERVCSLRKDDIDRRRDAHRELFYWKRFAGAAAMLIVGFIIGAYLGLDVSRRFSPGVSGNADRSVQAERGPGPTTESFKQEVFLGGNSEELTDVYVRNNSQQSREERL
ncbi:MAG: anti-sigma factor [bacterium]